MPHPRIYLYKRIVDAKLFIDANYVRRIDVSNIANRAYFSKFHFIRQFKKIYGKTPGQYLQAVRIEKAMEHLRAGVPVSDTCLLVGFESYTSFTALFKRMVGVTPSEYSEQQQARKVRVAREPLAFIPGCFAGSGRMV